MQERSFGHRTTNTDKSCAITAGIAIGLAVATGLPVVGGVLFSGGIGLGVIRAYEIWHRERMSHNVIDFSPDPK